MDSYNRMTMGRLIHDVNYAILVATEDTAWWLRPFQVALWWLWVGPKIPILMLYGDLNDRRDDDQKYPGGRV